MTDNSPATDEEVEAALDEWYREVDTREAMRKAIGAASRIRAETAKNSGEVVAWQCLDKHGHWITMPGDWTLEENIKGYEYRPLYAAPDNSCTEQAEVVGWVSQREYEHLRKGNVASIGPKSYERVMPVYSASSQITEATPAEYIPEHWRGRAQGIVEQSQSLNSVRREEAYRKAVMLLRILLVNAKEGGK